MIRNIETARDFRSVIVTVDTAAEAALLTELGRAVYNLRSQIERVQHAADGLVETLNDGRAMTRGINFTADNAVAVERHAAEIEMILRLGLKTFADSRAAFEEVVGYAQAGAALMPVTADATEAAAR